MLQGAIVGGEDKFQISTFEIYPEVHSVYPTSGSYQGGTTITVSGTGFMSTYPWAPMVRKIKSRCTTS